jgi:uncharacterized protein YjbI with pentapeptide repeats
MKSIKSDLHTNRGAVVPDWRDCNLHLEIVFSPLSRNLDPGSWDPKEDCTLKNRAACFEEGYLEEACLEEACFEEAFLEEASLEEACLEEACLKEACLEGACLKPGAWLVRQCT